MFEGGFLGLDNIGVFDRSAPLPTGGYLEQADGTAWMAFYAQAMLQISLELAVEDRAYVDMALKFFEHFVWIASAIINFGGQGEKATTMWSEEDGFFYDVLRTPDGRSQQLKVRSMIGSASALRGRGGQRAGRRRVAGAAAARPLAGRPSTAPGE